MTALPMPPAAYWANIPWWGYLGFFLTAIVIIVVIGPWAVQRARNKPSANLSREQSLVAREAVLDGQREAYVADLVSERDRIVGRLRVAEGDRDLGWDLARGAELLLHRKHHDLCDMIQQRNDAFLLIGRVASGSLRAEIAGELAKEHPPIAKPEPLPPLRSIERKKPGETAYA